MKWKKTLGKKLTVVYVCLIILPFSFMFLFFSVRAVNEVELTYSDFMLKNNSYVNQQLNQVIEDVHKFASLQMFDGNVEEIISKDYHQESMEYISDIKVMSEFILTVNSLKTPYYDIVYVGVNGEFYSNNRSFDFDLSEEVYVRMLETHVASNDTISISPIVELNGKESIIFTRTLLNSKTLKQKGYCMASLSLSELNRYLSLRSTNGKNYNDFDNEFIVVSNDEVIYNTGTRVIDDESFKSAIIPVLEHDWEDNIKVITVSKERLLFAKKFNEDTGWTILQYKPISIINSLMLSSLFVYLWTMVPIFIAFIIIAGYISKKVIRPINYMTDAMKYLEKGEFTTINEKAIGNDEMGFLMGTYNKTITKLETTIYKQYIAELFEKKAEIKMLESQINPHFLFNALNTMSSIAEINNIEEISHMAGSLSEILRFNLQKGSVVTIEEEITQVENYISIQKIRFRDKFIFIKRLNENEEIIKNPILKFLIQPLVENAIYHGLEKKNSNGMVSLEIKEIDNKLYIQIEDDGVGMTKDKLALLKSKLSGSSKAYINREDYESIGLENVNFRIKDYYGQQYGLDISSEINKYTKVCFYIPIIKGDQDEDSHY